LGMSVVASLRNLRELLISKEGALIDRQEYNVTRTLRVVDLAPRSDAGLRLLFGDFTIGVIGARINEAVLALEVRLDGIDIEVKGILVFGKQVQARSGSARRTVLTKCTAASFQHL